MTAPGPAGADPLGPLHALAPRVWQRPGPATLFDLPRTTTLWRAADGRIWLHGAPPAEPEILDAVAALGAPATLVLRAADELPEARRWRARFPALVVLAAPGLAAPGPGLPDGVDGLDTEAEGVEVLPLPGLTTPVHAYRLDCGAGAALVFGDALANHRHRPGLAGLYLRLTGRTGPFAVPTAFRRARIADGAALAEWLRAQAADPTLALLCLTHGDPILADPAVKLRAAADDL